MSEGAKLVVAPSFAARPPVPTPAPAIPSTEGKAVYRFAKLWGVAEELKFKDGSRYTFRLIKRNNQPGFGSTSSVETSDEKLAENLRELAKTNNSIREVVKQS